MANGFSFDTSGNEGGPSAVESEQRGEPGTVGNATTDNGTKQANDGTVEAPVIKRRGRQPYPRNAEGNIIRPDGTTGTAPKSARKPQSTGASLGVNSFVPNDKAKVRGQIQGLHAALATITKQPVFMLSEQEAEALTKALCDVLDYHKINLTAASGPWGLYATLGLVAFSIYKPRLNYIAAGGGQQVEGSARPATPGAAANQSGPIDLAADIEAQANANSGQFTYN